MARTKTKNKQKTSPKQREEAIRKAEERAKREEAQRVAKEQTKRIFTIVVCVILALALTLPTMGLLVLGGQ